MKYKTAGIIGGMGALATVDIFQKIVLNTYVECDQDHIPVLIDNNTQVPDRTKFLLGQGENPLKTMAFSAIRLQNMGADFLLLGCNTAHALFEELSNCVDIPIINIIEETVKEAHSRGYKKVGLLATEGFIKHASFQPYYDSLGIEVCTPHIEEQEAISSLINAVKANSFQAPMFGLSAVFQRMQASGAEAFVLSCTELPLVFSMCKEFEPFTGMYDMLDPNLVLAQKAICLAGGRLLCSQKSCLSIAN
ncbi:MAG: amino acid racemase [Eubacteriaceae bacterium]|nr:amino acid racemase [Eubacteriaceae bacterium]